MNRNIINNALENYQSSIQIYTDASKSDIGTSCAFYIPCLNTWKTYKINKSATIFFGEAMAKKLTCKNSNIKLLEKPKDDSRLKRMIKFILSDYVCMFIINDVNNVQFRASDTPRHT